MDKTVIQVTHKPDEDFLTTNDVRDMLNYYADITSKTGTQLSWSYEDVALPYDIEEDQTEGKTILHLKTKDPSLYKHLLISVLTEEKDEGKQSFITIHLPSDGTSGDKGKANEFAKFLAGKYHGSLTLFNGRVMSFT